MSIVQRPWCACCRGRVAAGWGAASVPCPGADSALAGLGCRRNGGCCKSLPSPRVPLLAGALAMPLGTAQPRTRLSHTYGKVCFTTVLKVWL